MKKIVFLTALTLWSMGQNKGGPAFTKTVGKYLDEGWDVYLLSDVPQNREYPYLAAEKNIVIPPSPFQRWIGLRKIGVLFRWLNHLWMTRVFQKEIRQREILDGQTVLYAYEIFGVKAAKQLSERSGAPIVSRFQGTILSQYRNTLLNRIARYPHYQALAEKTDLVIMTDDGTQGDRVLDDLGNDSPRLFLRNGLDLMERDIPQMKAAFDRAAFRSRFGITGEEPLFLTVSRLETWKRVDRAIEGFSTYCGMGGAGKLLVVGDGAEKASLEALCEQRGLADRVVFTGAVAHEEVYSYMMACDVFLSLYDLSNVGNPLLEAMALGTCIVTLDVGDTAKLIQNGRNGVLLTIAELRQLGETLLRLEREPECRTRLSDAAAATARQNFYGWGQRMDLECAQVSALLEKPGSI